MIIKCNRCNKEIINPNKDNSKYIFIEENVSKIITEQLITSPTHAEIIGNINYFIGQENDKIKITINGVIYDNIDISNCQNISEVVNKINEKIVPNESTITEEGYIKIVSIFYGINSQVSIEDGTNIGSAQTVVERLFSILENRSNIGKEQIIETIQNQIEEIETKTWIICPECSQSGDIIIW
jgi:hypothetical protein